MDEDVLMNCSIPLLEELPMSTLVPSSIAYVLIFAFGVVGNFLVAFVIWRNSDMRSSTNYYLLNLSIADMLVLLICMPVALIETYILEKWILGEHVCTLVSFMENTCAHATILTHVAISIERYYVICKPLKANYRCTARRTVTMCTVVWFVSLLSCVPHIVFARHTPCLDSSGNTKYQCEFSFENEYFSITYVLLVPILFFFCPVVFLSTIYAKVGLTLRRHDDFIASMKEEQKTDSLFRDKKTCADDCNVGKDTREMAVFLGFRMMGICGVDGYASVNNTTNNRMLSREKLIRDVRVNSSGTENVKFNGLVKSSITTETGSIPEYPSDETSCSDRRFSQICDVKCKSSESTSFLAKLTRNGIRKTSSNTSYQRQHHIRIVFMLICVVISFFICWLPFRILNMWFIISPQTVLPSIGISGYYGVVIFARVMVYLNSAINPILYNAISSKFRTAFKRVCCAKPTNNRRQNRQVRSTSSYPSNLQSRKSQVDQV